MFGKWNFLISCFLVLGLSSNALAYENLNPPYWVGAHGSSWAIWEFDEDAVEGVWLATEYVGDEENHNHPDSLWGMEGAGEEVLAAFATWGMPRHDSYAGRSGVVEVGGEILGFINNYPRDEDKFKRIRIQAIYQSATPQDLDVECETACAPLGGEGWNYWPGEESWFPWFEPEYIDLGGGWWHVTMEVDTQYQTGTEDFTLNPGAEVFFIWGVTHLDEVIVDTICYTGADPLPPSPYPRPPNGAIRVDPNELLLIWTPEPSSTAEIVYFSDNFADVDERSEDANMGVQDANYYPDDGNYLDVNLGTTYYWAIDETLNIGASCEAPGCVWNWVWSFTTKTKQAAEPSPEDDANYVSPCPTLEWDPGYGAVTHKVYWSDVFAEVNDRTIDPCVLNEPTDESLSIGPLAFDTEYFWAVDEVNDGDVCTPGEVWSFQTGPDPATDAPDWRSSTDSLYAMWGFTSDWGDGNMVADANWVIPADPCLWEANCVDSPNDWMASYTPGGGTIRYGIADMDGPAGGPGENTIRLKHTDYAKPGQDMTIRAALVWSGENSPTVVLERLTNWGSGPEPEGGFEAWAEAGNIKNSSEPAPIYEFQLCDGWMYSVYEAEFYAVPPADNIHVLIETYGDFYLDYVEVDARWYFLIPPPPFWPLDGAVDVPLDTCNLVWLPGAFADKHDVYFGTNEDAVTDANVSNPMGVYQGRQDANEYPESGCLELNSGTTYYWRVDEVNDACDPCLWPGAVWSFTTIAYVVIDDFESYTSTTHLEATWNDWQHTGPGGGWNLNNAATTILAYDPCHSSTRSLDFDYDFSISGVDYAIIRQTFDPGVHDFTAGGTPALWLWFYGDANDGAGRLADGMSLTLGDDDNGDGTVDDSWTIHYGNANCVYTGDGDANDLVAKQWMEWSLALEDFNEANNVNPDKIKSIAIGINGGTTGDIYFDDIRLYAPRCIPEYSRQFGDFTSPYVITLAGPGWETDCLINDYDVQLMAWDWLVRDVNVTAEAVSDADANLLVHYVFDDVNGLNDVSGNDYDGIGINDVNIHDGILTLVNDDSPDVNAVQISGLAADNPFRGKAKGGGDFTVAMWFQTEEPSILFSSCPYDPDVTEPPNDLDPSNHAMSVFIARWDETLMQYDNWYVNAAGVSDTPTDGKWHHMATTYNAETNDHITYLDGVPGGTESFDPNLVNPQDHKIQIGTTLNPIFPYEDGSVDLTGDVDDVLIYDRVLSHGEIVFLAGVPPGEYLYIPVPSDAEIYSKEPRGERYVNFRDYAILANNWLKEVFWP